MKKRQKSTANHNQQKPVVSKVAIRIRGVTIPICKGSKSGSGITKRLKILLLNWIHGYNHNTSIGVTIPLLTGSESRSGIAQKAENLTPDPDAGPALCSNSSGHIKYLLCSGEVVWFV